MYIDRRLVLSTVAFNDEDAGFKSEGRVYVYEAYTFMIIEPHTATNQLQMCVYGGRHIATLAEAAWLGNLHNGGGQFYG